MFKITSGKGFHLTFENGWTISVQWGLDNYCENRKLDSIQHKNPQSKDAEVMVWDRNGEPYRLSKHDDVIGWQSTNDVAKLIAKVAAFK